MSSSESLHPVISSDAQPQARRYIVHVQLSRDDEPVVRLRSLRQPYPASGFMIMSTNVD